MRQPGPALTWMSLFLAVVALLALLLAAPLARAFLANPAFNGMILFVLLTGLIVNYRQVLVLKPEVDWVRRFRRSESPEDVPAPQTRLLGAMARLLGERHGQQFTLSTTSLRTLLDGIRSRLDESRDLSRYFIGLLVFLGLLGTFWGLLETLGGVRDVVAGLNLGGDDVATAFQALQSGIEQPLSGLGTAFSSSLFGLAGALVLGFIDLQAGHAQNRFYNELEEWLSERTRLSSGALGAEGEGSVPVYIQALLEQTADSLDKLQRIMARSEEERRSADQHLAALSGEMAGLMEQLRSEQKGMLGLARTQNELQSVLQQLAEATGARGEHEAAMREQLTRVAATMDALRGDLGDDRGQLIETLREEIRLLTRTVARLADGNRGG